MLQIVAAGLVTKPMRLVMMRSAIRGMLAVRTEPDDSAARPDEVRGEVGGCRQARPFLHQSITRSRQPRRLALAANEYLCDIRYHRRITHHAAGEARDCRLVLRFMPPTPVAEV